MSPRPGLPAHRNRPREWRDWSWRPAKQKLCSPTAHCARSTLEAHLQSVLTELRVVEGSERRGGDVRLDVRRQKCVERIVGTHADPRAQLENLEPVLEPEIDTHVGRHPLRVARAD